jgi:hypothetical protein
MPSQILACGPYFDETGVIASLIVLLAIKPLSYFAFIQAFRYRVSRPIPMRLRQAVRLTVARAALGPGIIAAAALALGLLGSDSLWMISWLVLLGERVFVWWVIGRSGAGLAGRRLIGWVFSGTLIDTAFDLAIVAGLMTGWALPAVVSVAVAGLIAVLHVAGRRASLRRRFVNGSQCAGCGYDLTGNLSGRCPECGDEIAKARPIMAARAA